jgi:hypothetical protein
MAGDHRREVLLNGARHAANVLEPIAYSVPLSIWVGYLGESLESDTAYWDAFRDLGLKNGILLTTLVVIVTMEIVKARREERRKRKAAVDVLKTERSGQRILLAILSNANAAVSRSLGVTTNVRYMPVVDVDGHKQLIQARDLHIEQVRMPSEYGFTGLSIDDPAIVSARSFTTRSPIYEELPVDHMDLYSAEVATMIDARQRWVLACPVLSIDGVGGDLRRDREPHGVLVFYGVDVPHGEQIEEEIRESLGYAQKAAEAFSFVLEIGDAVGDLGNLVQ